jgi:hypothetical protein
LYPPASRRFMMYRVHQQPGHDDVTELAPGGGPARLHDEH